MRTDELIPAQDGQGAPVAPDRPPHVVIIGGGFAGLYATRRLAGAAVRITLVDRRNHHLFQPLLYQVATAGLSAPDVAAPIRRVLRRQANATVLLGEVTAVRLADRVVTLDGAQALAYDYLVLAAGTETSYFGNDGWRRHAPGLKSIEDAFEVRRRVLFAFERAEREPDAARRARDLRFVVVGAGPTGVELAGALREIAARTLALDFRNFDPDEAQVLLIDASERVLPGFPEGMSRRAAAELERLRVVLRTGERVGDIDADGVLLRSGERIQAGTVLWAAGVVPSPLAAGLGCERTPDGRVLVEPDLSLPGHDEVFVVGDLAAVRQANGDWVPGMAPGAIQMGRHAARSILRDVQSQPRQAFRYGDRGLLATVGRSHAVAEVGGRQFSGFIAWLLWVFVHIFWLIGFRQRLVVLFEWAWAWITWQRSARVIPGGAKPMRREN